MGGSRVSVEQIGYKRKKRALASLVKEYSVLLSGGGSYIFEKGNFRRGVEYSSRDAILIRGKETEVKGVDVH